MKHKKNSSPENEPEYIEELEEDEEIDEEDDEEDYDEDEEYEDDEDDEDDEDEDEEDEKPRGLKAFFAKIKSSLFEEVEEDDEEEEEEDDEDLDEDEEEEFDDEEDEEEPDEDEDNDETEDSEPSEESEPEVIVIPEEMLRTEEDAETQPDDGEIFLDAPEDMPDFREEAVPGYQPPPKKEPEPEETEQPDSETPVIKEDELTVGLDDFFSDEKETDSDEEDSETDIDEDTEDSKPDDEEETDASEPDDDEEDEEEQNSDGTPKKSILSKLIPVVAVLVVVLGFVYCFQLGLFDEKEAFLMPELVGRNYYELTDEEYANLDIQVNQSAYSAYDKDFIYAQDIPSGTEIKLGQTVKVDLSLGYQMTVVPDVRNYQFDYAKKLLEQTGFKTQIAYEQSLNGTAQNNVIRTVPGSNEEAAVGSEVTLYVSEGLGAEAAQVQNFTGMLLEDALDLCEMYGLEVEAVPAPALQAENVVVSQSIEAGAVVPFHTVITLTYSTGEQPQGTVSYQVNFPAYASGRFILDFIDKDGNVVASSDIIVAGFSAGSVVPIDGFGAQEITVVLNNCTTNLQAELGKYYFDFTTGTYTMLSEDMQGAFEAVKGIA